MVCAHKRAFCHQFVLVAMVCTRKGGAASDSRRQQKSTEDTKPRATSKNRKTDVPVQKGQTKRRATSKGSDGKAATKKAAAGKEAAPSKRASTKTVAARKGGKKGQHVAKDDWIGEWMIMFQGDDKPAQTRGYWKWQCFEGDDGRIYIGFHAGVLDGCLRLDDETKASTTFQWRGEETSSYRAVQCFYERQKGALVLSTSGDRNTIKGTLRGYFGKDVLEFEGKRMRPQPGSTAAISMWKDCYITLGSSADDSASESGDDEPSPAKPAAAKGGKKAAAASTKSGKSNAQAAEEGDWIGEWMVRFGETDWPDKTRGCWKWQGFKGPDGGIYMSLHAGIVSGCIKIDDPSQRNTTFHWRGRELNNGELQTSFSSQTGTLNMTKKGGKMEFKGTIQFFGQMEFEGKRMRAQPGDTSAYSRWQECNHETYEQERINRWR